VILSLSLESRPFGEIVGCCGTGDGVAGGTDGEALFVGLPRAIGAGVDPVPGPGDAGGVGAVDAGTGLVCESDGLSGGSIPPIGTIVGDARGFAEGCFFVSGDGDKLGDTVLASFFGAPGAVLCLFPPDSLGYKFHSSPPFIGGKVGFGSTGADGEREGPIAEFDFSLGGLFFSADASILEDTGEGEG
jgi:hypothetical protein